MAEEEGFALFKKFEARFPSPYHQDKWYLTVVRTLQSFTSIF